MNTTKQAPNHSRTFQGQRTPLPTIVTRYARRIAANLTSQDCSVVVDAAIRTAFVVLEVRFSSGESYRSAAIAAIKAGRETAEEFTNRFSKRDLDPVAPGFKPSWDSRNDTPPHCR